MIITDPNQIQATEEEKSALDERKLVDSNWARYEYGRDRGHDEYCAQARKNERFYLGGGLQWDDADAAVLRAAGRPVTEINEIMPAVNSAVGYQIANRLEFTFLPRSESASKDTAETISKVIKQIMDNNQHRWLETDVFEDGLIQQRGYFDIRPSFDDSLLAEARIHVLDPLDVIPDPDAKSYNPDRWADVITTYWMDLDTIEQSYGTKKRLIVENYKISEQDFGDDSQNEGRNKFGDSNSGGVHYDAWLAGISETNPRVRVIDRQYWMYVETQCALMPTGDVRVVEGLPPESIAALTAMGASIIKRKMRRVRWLVTTRDVVLFDDWSPMENFTIVPYFPYFRRGKTRGMVDNAISPQETLNKAMSSMLHTTNSVANSGWITEENTVNNLSPDELRAQGAQTGLHIEVKAGTPRDRWPDKIQPNSVPAGFDRIIEHSHRNLQDVTVSDELRGKGSDDMSGVAFQSRQFAAQQGMARALDNLSRTRHMVGMRLLKFIQKFMDDPRTLRIRQVDKLSGKEYDEQVRVNQPTGDGNYINDLTVGEYDLVIAEVPINVTFDNSQFQQAMEMKKEGVPIPDPYLIKSSTLREKSDIIAAMEGNQKPDPRVEAEVEKIKAETEKIKAESVVKNVEGIFSATEAAQNIAALPQVAPLADDILGSAGYTDKNGAPLVQQPQGIPQQRDVPLPRENTDPRFPRNPTSPAAGMMAGIEGG